MFKCIKKMLLNPLQDKLYTSLLRFEIINFTYIISHTSLV